VKKNDFIWHSKKPTKQHNSKIDHSNHAKNHKESSDSEIPIFSMQETEKNNKHQKKFKKSIWTNPILIATVSAVVLGLMIGAITLKFFSNVETTKVETEETSTQAMQQTVTKDEKKELGIQGYALQGGVFKKKNNAKKWAKIYQKKDVETFIWERDKQYYLFIHMVHSKDKAKQLIDKIDDDKIDVFIKKWKIKPSGDTLTSEEREWVDTFEKDWTKAIKEAHSDKKISVKTWETLLSKIPKESKNLKTMKKEVSKTVKILKNQDTKNIDIQLMKLSAIYEAL